MAKVTVIPTQQSSAQFEPGDCFTQVGGIYGAEIRPEDFLVSADMSEYRSAGGEIENVNGEREPRFFRVR